MQTIPTLPSCSSLRTIEWGVLCFDPCRSKILLLALMRIKARYLAIILCVCLPHLAFADGLVSYLASLGPPTAIQVTERQPQGPARIAFQSQVWRSLPWRHELIVKTPSVLRRRDLVVISLTGGHGGDAHHEGAQRFADALGVRAVVLTQVPNQPLFGGKTEDDLLSFTLNEYRQSGDPSWPLLFPMVSSVVKGIDVLQQVLSEPDLKVVLIGASKRGWTTYLSAAFDSRIVGMVPAVFEMVSMRKQIALARSRYGRDSEKIRPYTVLGLTDAFLEPRVAQLVSWLDPKSYAQRYTIPKLVLLGANDPYWVVDSVRAYWDVLPEPKILRILPNVGHSVLAEEQAREAIVSFVELLLRQHKPPHATWNFSSSAGGRAIISGVSHEPLTHCRLWRANSPSTDFRKALFTSYPCEVLADGKSFRATVVTCTSQHTAAFAELSVRDAEHATSGPKELSLSTESHVWLASQPAGRGVGETNDSAECR